MKYYPKEATKVEPESTKYFYVYEISCDGVIIPFNPNYLISYLVNDKVLLESYSGNVYQTVTKTYAALGNRELEFSLTLKVNTVKITAKELIDIIYRNYDFDSIEDVKKLIIIASCSKAMLVSMLYLIFFNLINKTDLEHISSLTYEDLYEFVLNMLKHSCLTENPLDTNFESYIDELNRAECEFTDSDDKTVEYECVLNYDVNPNTYKNVVKIKGTSISYDKTNIVNLTHKTATWKDAYTDKYTEYVQLSDTAANTLTAHIKNDIAPAKYNFTIDIGCLTVTNVVGSDIRKKIILKNNTEDTIVIPNAFKFSVYNYSILGWFKAADTSTTTEVILKPGDSVNLCEKVSNGNIYSNPFASYIVGFYQNQAFNIVHREPKWYDSLQEDIDYGRLSIVPGTEVNQSNIGGQLYHMTMRTTEALESNNFRSLGISSGSLVNNTTDLIFTIPSGTTIRGSVSYWAFQDYFFKKIYRDFTTITTSNITISPGGKTSISYNVPSEITNDIESARAYDVSYSVTQIASTTTVYISSTATIPITTSTVTLPKQASILACGDTFSLVDGKINIDGLALISTNTYNDDIYAATMSVTPNQNENISVLNSMISSAYNTSQLSNLFMLNNNSHGVVNFKVDSTCESLANYSTLDDYTANNIAIADLRPSESTDDEVTVVSRNVLLSKTENVGLKYKPEISITLPADATEIGGLYTKDNIDIMINKFMNLNNYVSLSEDQMNSVIKVNKFKYRLKLILRFTAKMGSYTELRSLLDDLRFVLQYSKFIVKLDGHEYQTNIERMYLESSTLDSEDEFNKFAASHPKTINILTVILRMPDVSATLDISNRDVCVYNNKIYNGFQKDYGGN